MPEFVWHHIRYWSGPEPRYSTVIVLAWHEGTATVIDIDDSGIVDPKGRPYIVKTDALQIGYPPKP